jgi:hypothetical protein
LVALAKRRTSSAKNRWDRGGPFFESLTGFQRPSSIFFIIMCDKYSMHNTKRYGDKGSPFLSPLVGVKLGRRRPFHKIDREELVTQNIINFIDAGGKPLLIKHE